MTVRRVLPHQHELLRLRCREVENARAPAVQELVLDLIETLFEHHALGLAANQIGRRERVMVFRSMSDPQVQVAINPRIEAGFGRRSSAESCLSIADKTVSLARYETLLASWTDHTGEQHRRTLAGVHAVVFQHELDHLDGKLMTDHPHVELEPDGSLAHLRSGSRGNQHES